MTAISLRDVTKRFGRLAAVEELSLLRAPDTPLSLFLTLFPPSAPFILLLRMSLPSAVPVWQIALSVVLMIAGTLVVVWAAGKIFRVGILMYGKSATFPEMLRWIRAV